jgi:hypothetical protein
VRSIARKSGSHPDTFLIDHGFATESLIDLCNASGYRIDARHTTLRARFPDSSDATILGIRQGLILEVEQRLEAVRVETSGGVTLEYLRACYVRWEITSPTEEAK